MYSYEDVKDNPTLILGLSGETEIQIACSRCGNPKHTKQFRVKRALAAHQTGMFCSRSCKGKHRYEQQLESRKNVLGRVCLSCQNWKPLPKFPNKGKSRRCSPCAQQTPKKQYQEYLHSARKRGHSFTTTYKEFMAFWQKPCDYCGEAISAIGIDRVDNTKGYEVGNLVACCEPCNKMKHLLTRGEFLALCRAISARHPC